MVLTGRGAHPSRAGEPGLPRAGTGLHMEGPAVPSTPSLGASCCRSQDCTQHHPILGQCTPSPGRLLGPLVHTPQRAGAAGASLQLQPPGHAGLVSVSEVLALPPRPLVPPEGDQLIPTSTEQASFLNPHHSWEAGTVLSGGGNCPGSMRPQATRAWCSRAGPWALTAWASLGCPSRCLPRTWQPPAAAS